MDFSTDGTTEKRRCYDLQVVAAVQESRLISMEWSIIKTIQHWQAYSFHPGEKGKDK